jgi:dTDP-4-amino-4,6-dideoxygalactose transaminase
MAERLLRMITNSAGSFKSMRNYGSEIKYHNDYIGMNSRLDELQASFWIWMLTVIRCTDNELRREGQKVFAGNK